MKRRPFEILNGDCLDILKWIENNSIHLTVTSPPYDNLRGYEALPFDKFLHIAKELFRVTIFGGVVVWIVGDATIKGSETGTSFRQALAFKDLGFKLHDTMIYHKDGPPLTQKRYEPKFEYMFIFVKGDLKTFNGLREASIFAGVKRSLSFRSTGDKLHAAHTPGVVRHDKLRGNVWNVAVGGGKSTKDKFAFEHPAIFPEKLAHDHILSWSNEYDTVLDPFLGSGTTGKMALKLNRNFIGIEIDEKYFQIAKQRMHDFR